MPRKLLFGVAVNDSDVIVFNAAAKRRCMYYVRWRNMLVRCYSQKYQEKHPTYAGCTVCDEWLAFSNFKAWMIEQDWKGKQLDKDILVAGNKVYSPDTCVFVDARINAFIIDGNSRRGDCMLGVHFNKQKSKLEAYCSNPFTKKHEQLGCFDDELSAHLAWKSRKHEIACQLAETQSDFRVVAALRARYV